MKKQLQGHSPIERILWASLWVPSPSGGRGLPYVLVGDPGTVKTSMARELATMAGIGFEALISSIRQPQDFLGMPALSRLPLTKNTQHLSPNGDDSIGVCDYAAPKFAISAALRGRSLVLMDEVSTCPPTVQAALLRVLFERVVGDFALPEGTRMLLAMNEIEDAAGGWDLALPLTNRVGWLDWSGPDFVRYSEYMMSGGGCRVGGKLRRQVEPLVDPEAEEAEVDRAWPVAWATAWGLVAGFLQARPDALHRKPNVAERNRVRAWPSRRTWDFATAALAMGEVFDLTDMEVATAASAYVGAGVWREFHSWRRNADLPNSEEFLDGVRDFKHLAARLDRTAAVLASTTSLLCSMDRGEKQKARVARMWSFLRDLPGDASDVAAASVLALTRARLQEGHDEAYRVYLKMEGFLAAAGVTAPV